MQKSYRWYRWEMDKVFLTGSGSEAMEIALKLSRQYFFEQDKNTSRANFISRENSYHGNTLGALAISGLNVPIPSQLHAESSLGMPNEDDLFGKVAAGASVLHNGVWKR
jgi:adenosylmethionine-8-amino-7-oxononanoate aminotransferase